LQFFDLYSADPFVMKRILFSLVFVAVGVLAASAQGTPDHNKTEFFAGYSNGQVGGGLATSGISQDSRLSFNGFEASGVYNVSRYIGLKGDLSGTYKKTQVHQQFTSGGVTQTASYGSDAALYNFLGGVQLKDNASAGRLKAFAHALIGAGHARVTFNNVACIAVVGVNCTNRSEIAFAGAFGGGLDIRLNDRLDVRAIQADYNPIKFADGTQNNFRVGVGLVIK